MRASFLAVATSAVVVLVSLAETRTTPALHPDSLARYEAQRERGAHDGPPLRAVRLYDAHWTLESDARNVDRPDRVHLVDEVSAPAAGRSSN